MGALTSKPYAFSARPWELEKTYSLDFFDALGSPIRIDTRGLELMRVLPRPRGGFSEDWISDKVRFSYDGLRRQRLSSLYGRSDMSFKPFSWEKVLSLLAYHFFIGIGNFPSRKFNIFLGPFLDLDFFYVLREFLFIFLRSGIDRLTVFGTVPGVPLSDWRSDYLALDLSIFDRSDLVLFVGASPRFDSPVFNIKARKLAQKGVPVYFLGTSQFQGYESFSIGSSYDLFFSILEGKHPLSSTFFTKSAISVVFGDGFYRSSEFSLIVDIFRERVPNFSFFYLPQFRAPLNFLDSPLPFSFSFQPDSGVGLRRYFSESLAKVYDFSFFSDQWAPVKDFSDFAVYLGSHGDRFVSRADLLLPSVTPLEKSSFSLDLGGTTGASPYVFSGPANARTDWKVVSAFANVLGFSSFPSTLSELCNAREKTFGSSSSLRLCRPKTSSFPVVSNFPFLSFSYRDYFSSDYISRASSILALRRRRFEADGNFSFII